MKKLMLLAALAIGYVLGARAGRERYEQIMSAFNRVKDDPRVQEKAQQGVQLVREQAPVVAEKVADAARTATDKVTSHSTGDDADARIEEAVQYQKDHGPKGPLP
jgi:hypothetical protein